MKKENYPTVASVKLKWREVGEGWKTYLAGLNEELLPRSLTFHNLKGEEVTQQIGQSLQHLVNHSTYHRGQITTMVPAKRRNAGRDGSDRVLSIEKHIDTEGKKEQKINRSGMTGFFYCV